MKTVVTGASGHVGGVLVRALLERGRSVLALYNSDKRALEGLGCDSARVALDDLDGLRRAFDGAEVVHHCAAMVSISGDPTGAVWRTNVDGVRTVMRAAREAGVGRVVHCSSMHAFDLHSVQGLFDETFPVAHAMHCGPYERSKAAGEHEVRRAVAQGLDAVIVNPTGVIGPYDFKPGRMGRFFLDLAHGALPALIEGGVDYVDVRDVCEGALAAETRGQRGQSHLLGGRWASIREVATLAQQYTGVRPPRLTTPMPLATLAAPFAQAWSRVRGSDPLFTPEALLPLRSGARVDTTRARTALDYTARPLEQTIEELYKWFRERGQLEKGRE